MGNRNSQQPTVVSPGGPTPGNIPASLRLVQGKVENDFQLEDKVLGTGFSGAVKLATHKTTGQQVAVKMFRKNPRQASRVEMLKNEVGVYLRLDHPNICRLLYAYESKKIVTLVMELCGSELYDRLCERKVYKEADAAGVTHQMLQAVSYLHSHNIVHRDLKLENWMYSVEQNDDRIKLIDFGFSRIVEPDGTMDMPCGTLHYASPEVLRRKYNSKCDMWSLGVICYMLLTGTPPFHGQNNQQIVLKIKGADITQNSRWANLSSVAKSFISKLLERDIDTRWGATQALAHPFITNEPTGSPASRMSSVAGDIDLDVLDSLRRFARSSHLRRAAFSVMAYGLTSAEIDHLRDIFLSFDTNDSGTITLADLATVMQKHVSVESGEVERIFKSLDFANDEEVHYTQFLAAMLTTRIRFHEDMVLNAFKAFDRDDSGFITVDNLVELFAEQEASEGKSGTGLTKADAERWIQEVDLKGNGVVDYEEFLAALKGDLPDSTFFGPAMSLQQRILDEQPEVVIHSDSQENNSPHRASQEPNSAFDKLLWEKLRASVLSVMDGEQKKLLGGKTFPHGKLTRACSLILDVDIDRPRVRAETDPVDTSRKAPLDSQKPSSSPSPKVGGYPSAQSMPESAKSSAVEDGHVGGGGLLDAVDAKYFD